MPAYRVRAYNTAHSSENKIHDDVVARRFGFAGALVPGVDVYAYMMHLPVARWGRAFLERGTAECRFTSPVYDGHIAEVFGSETSDAIAIEVRSEGATCATGSARLPEEAPVPLLDTFPEVEPPPMEKRPEANEATLGAGVILASHSLQLTVELTAEYLRDVCEADALYVRQGLVHPGTVLRMCNLALLHSVRLGPWIHTASSVQNFAAARTGEALAARARVTRNYERKGHRFVELDVLVLGSNTGLLSRVQHTAIYRPRQ